jgi:hypothetical protein
MRQPPLPGAGAPAAEHPTISGLCCYHLYGTAVFSSTPLLLDLPAVDTARQQIELRGSSPTQIMQSRMTTVASHRAHGREIRLRTGGASNRPGPGQSWCFEVKDVVRFDWESGGSLVHHEAGSQGNPKLLTFWFVHLMLPLYLALERRYDMLHAGAVELDGKPVLFVAPSMGGKSTLTDHFVRQGHPLISDDKVPGAIEDGAYAVGGSHPYHRPFRRFEELGYPVERFSPAFRRVRTLYLLQRCEPLQPVSIEEVRGFRMFESLQPNQLFGFSFYRERQLTSLAAMLNQSRLFRVALPWSTERLAEVYDAIRSHHGSFV